MLDFEQILEYLEAAQIGIAINYLEAWVSEKESELNEVDEELLLHLMMLLCQYPESFGDATDFVISLINAAFYKEEDPFITNLELHYPAKKLIEYCLSLAKAEHPIFQFPRIQKYVKTAFQHSNSLFRRQFMQDPGIVHLVCQHIHPNELINVYGESILQCAVNEASEEVFKALIERSADVNGIQSPLGLRRRRAGFGYDPMRLKGFPAMSLFSDLDDAEESPVAKKDEIHPEAHLMLQASSPMDFNPLQLAIIEHRNELVLQLLAHHVIQAETQVVSVSLQTDEGDIYRNPTALMLAAYVQNHQALSYLIQKGVQLNQVDNAGETALMYAARVQSYECIALLLKAGADFNKKNAKGLNLIDIIQSFDYSELLARFERLEDFRRVLMRQPEKISHFLQRSVSHQLVPVPADGNCLYHALSLYLPYSHEQLREMAARYIENNLERYAGHIQGDIIAYIAQIRAGGWGDHLEIDAIHQLTGRPIVLFYENHLQAPSTFGVASEENPAIYLQYNNVNHYDGLVSIVENSRLHSDIARFSYWRNLIQLPMEMRGHIGSFISLETMRSLLGSYENMLRFFVEIDRENSEKDSPSLPERFLR